MPELDDIAIWEYGTGTGTGTNMGIGPAGGLWGGSGPIQVPGAWRYCGCSERPRDRVGCERDVTGVGRCGVDEWCVLDVCRESPEFCR